jgi:hypothetical protein
MEIAMFSLLRKALCPTESKNRVSRPVKSFGPTLTQLEDRLVMSLVTAGPINSLGQVVPGPIIANVQIEDVFYGSAWTKNVGLTNTNAYELSQEAKDLGAFFSTISKSTYMDGLAQYAGSNGAPGRGQYLDSYFDNTSLSLSTATYPTLSQLPLIQETTITDALKADITSNSVPKPDANKLYVIFLPPGTVDQRSTGLDKNGNLFLREGGHHDSFPDGALGTVYYAVINHPLALNSDNAETNLQNLTWMAAHEMVEAITDPVLGLSWVQRTNPTDVQGPEIGDIAGNLLPNNGWLGQDYGYAVVKYWSERDQANIPNIAMQPIAQIPYYFHGGTQFTLNGSVNVVFNYQDQNAYTPGAGYLGNDTFTGQWGTVSVHGTLFRNGNTILIAVYRDSDNSTVFGGSVSSSDGSWSWASLEISGNEISATGQLVFAFGVPSTNTLSYGGGGGGGGGSYVPPSHPPIVYQ